MRGTFASETFNCLDVDVSLNAYRSPVLTVCYQNCSISYWSLQYQYSEYNMHTPNSREHDADDMHPGSREVR